MATPKMALGRVKREIADVRKDKQAQTSGVKIILPDESNLLHLKGEIVGPPDTPFAGGIYELDINIPEQYPFNPPKVKFTTKIWHPNISSATGAICLDILTEKAWAAAMTLRTVLLSVQALLSAAEPDDPQDAVVASQYKRDREEYNKTARYWARTYANAPSKGGDDDMKAEEAQVQKLVDMGIDKQKAREALSAVGWNVEKAAQKVFS
eukprot:TRINITY_DN8149_c0_g1_i1.p1 TRINITY_DN8149_c0_g1~~TRINITY_DN8149_c0_g1_i1.p1  ORF type:complete len:232 (+),score=38.79 TRINITY_DN8149_c0_g1_i1:71-697(+)